jgi:hypothetical protein
MSGDIDQHCAIKALFDSMAQDASIAIHLDREAKSGEHPPEEGIPGEHRHSRASSGEEEPISRTEVFAFVENGEPTLTRSGGE